MLVFMLFLNHLICQGKQFSDYGKIYVVNIPATTTAPATVKAAIQNLFNDIVIEMGNHPTLQQDYTLLFPYRDYLIDDVIQINLLNNTSADKTLHVIGLETDLDDFQNNFPSHQQGDDGAAYNTYINNHVAKTNIACTNNPEDANFLESINPSVFPKIVNTSQQPLESFFIFQNQITPPPGTQFVFQNSLNMMGLEFTAENGSTQHIYPNTVAGVNWHPTSASPSNKANWAAIDVNYMKRINIDNIQIRNLWGRGIRVYNVINESSLSYQNNEIAEVHDNIIRNVWAGNNNDTPAVKGIEFLGVINGHVYNNIIDNDLSTTLQIAPGVGICCKCEFNKNILVDHNWVHGYDFSFWSETHSGGIIFHHNRSSGTEHGLTISKNTAVSNKPYLVEQIEHNYFTNTGLDPGIQHYCGQYDHAKHIYFDGGSTVNNFISFKHNKVELDRALFIQQKNYTSDALPQFTSGSQRNIVDIDHQSFVEFSCNTIMTTTTSASNGAPVWSWIYQPNCFVMGNTFENINVEAHSASAIQKNNTYNNVLNYTNWPDNTSLGTCQRSYLQSAIIGNFLLDYSLYHSCDNNHAGTFCFKLSGTNTAPPYQFYLNGEKLGFGPLLYGTITYLLPNTYTLSFTDANGVTGSFTFTVNQITLDITSTAPLCHAGGDGDILALMIDASPALNPGVLTSYVLSNLSSPVSNNNGLFTSLSAGTYTVTATDGYTCSLSTTVLLTDPPPISWSSTTIHHVSCPAGTDGEVDISATGGTGMITYSIDAINYQTASTFTALVAGNYTITAKDVNGCSIQTALTITEPTPILFTSSVVNVSCNGGQDGSAMVTPNGGTGPVYTYLWNPGGSINSNLSGVFAGNYTVTVTDGNNCTATTTVSIATDWINYCCNASYTSALAPKEHLEGIPYDYAISTHVPTLATYTGYTFFVHNNLVIDQSTTFDHCTLLFTANSKITVASGQSLMLAACTLKAGCNAMWDGIYASDPGSEVIINGGILQDMENGVVIANQGKLTADQTHFNSNYIGIQLNRLPFIYNGSIQRCTFDTPGPLLAPHDAQSNGEHGIRVSDCQFITIGHASDANKRNNFQHLYNGIYILNTRPNPLPLNPLQEVTIHCEYNTFSNIEGGAALWSNATNNGPQFYQDHRGCAIFGMNEWMPYPIKLFYKGNNNASFYDYLNCQKAILVNSFSTDVQFVKAENIDGGMLHYACDYHKQMVTNNLLNNTYLGVLVQGNTGGGFVNNNSMTLLAHPETSPSGSPLYWGKGIELSYFNNEAVNPVEVKNNTISSAASDWILGLSFLNCPYGTRKENLILFSTISNVLNPYPYPVLRGIQAISGKNNIFENNTVTGAYHYDALSYRRSVGIYMERNSRNTYNCNVNDYVYYGAYVLGNNAGNFDQFNRNTFRSSRYGILLRHLVDNGTLGDIGNQAIYDANNQFYDQSIAGVNNNKRVHRITTPSLCTDPNANQPTIFTSSNNLIQIHSTSNMPNYDCRYKVQNYPSFNFTFQCTPGTIQGNEEPDDGVLDIELAEDIAEDSVAYSEYAEVGKWMDELELYAQLDRDDSVRLTHPVLDSFYLSRRQSNLDKTYRIDRLLGDLSDSSIYYSPDLFYEKLSQAMALNDSLVLGDYFVDNEHWINSQLFNSIMDGVQSLHSDVRQQIADLSNECPYQAGKAVFKARTLNSMLNPMSNYDDLQICNAAGVYKTAGGKGLFDEENLQLDSMAKHDGLQLIFAKEKTGIKIYPNPAQDKIIIKYQLRANENGVLVLYDISGREQFRIQLSSMSTIVETFVSNLNDGVYSYKYMVNGMTFETGKLTILK